MDQEEGKEAAGESPASLQPSGLAGTTASTSRKTPSVSHPSTGGANVQPVGSDPARCVHPQATVQEHDYSRRKPHPEDKGGEKIQNNNQEMEALRGSA